MTPNTLEDLLVDDAARARHLRWLGREAEAFAGGGPAGRAARRTYEDAADELERRSPAVA
jgi:hypothetical protein